MTTPMHPDDLAALVLAMARESDRNKRARLGRRIADAYTSLFRNTDDDDAPVIFQSESARLLFGNGAYQRRPRGVGALADPERPLSGEDLIV